MNQREKWCKIVCRQLIKKGVLDVDIRDGCRLESILEL